MATNAASPYRRRRIYASTRAAAIAVTGTDSPGHTSTASSRGCPLRLARTGWTLAAFGAPGIFWWLPRSAGLDHGRVPYTCSNRAYGGRRPDWWCYPERRANGHDWAPGRIVVPWMPRERRPAAAAREHDPGHLVIYCQAPGCRSVAARQAIGAAQPSLPASCFQRVDDLIILG
jgi:hypothetical protein